MKKAVLYKKIDVFGRFCIPRDFRKAQGITEYDTLYVFADGKGIHIKKRIEGDNSQPTNVYERAMDDTGRIRIPYELREALALNPGVYLEVKTNEDGLYIVAPCECALCGNREGLKTFMTKYICTGCIDRLRAELGA